LEPSIMPGLPPDLDLVVRERRSDVRIVVSLPGRYSLANRRNTRGERRQFACRAINISCSGVALAVPVQGALGERVLADIEHFGKLEGTIERLLDNRGFVARIAASDEEREKLVDKIDWFEKHKNLEVPDKRTQARFVPDDPYSILLLADGSMVTCFVIDLSVSGAAVSADLVPEIGTVLAVGKVVGRVARHFSGGFAVQFVQVQDRENVEALALRK
jgi:hypothetical protein